MEDIVDMESELSKRLQEVMVVVLVIMIMVMVMIIIIVCLFQTGQRLEEAANSEVGKELGKVETSHSK